MLANDGKRAATGEAACRARGDRTQAEIFEVSDPEVYKHVTD